MNRLKGLFCLLASVFAGITFGVASAVYLFSVCVLLGLEMLITNRDIESCIWGDKL